MSWYLPAGASSLGNVETNITVESAGWNYSGLQVYRFDAGEAITFELPDDECVIVPLSAQNISLTTSHGDFVLKGREGVFAAVSDWLYLPNGSRVTMTAAAGEVAVCTARAQSDYPACYTSAQEVPVEVRGGGKASRQVTNIATPDSFTSARKINVCEVITPGGNWSSWPPHRHDGIDGCIATNEEIYYFRIGREESLHGDPVGLGTFHVYTVDGSVDESVTVKDGDSYLVPQGYHGPTIAPPEYPMYFLNVLAGPAEDRTMAFCDDPDHHWIRETWEAQGTDPRLPYTSAHGRVQGNSS